METLCWKIRIDFKQSSHKFDVSIVIISMENKNCFELVGTRKYNFIYKNKNICVMITIIIMTYEQNFKPFFLAKNTFLIKYLLFLIMVRHWKSQSFEFKFTFRRAWYQVIVISISLEKKFPNENNSFWRSYQ